jgi:lipopolysaccharide export system protein LptA
MTDPLVRHFTRPERLFAALAVLLAVLLPGAAAHAERADHDKPINIEADNMTYDDLRQVNVFIGHVVLTKGTILIKADRVVVTQDPQGYQYAVGTEDSGGLAYFRQKRDGVDEYIEGNAEKLDYDGKRDFTTLTSRATVRRLQGLSKVIDTVSGDVITYDGQKDFYTASANGNTNASGSGTGRVRAVLAPSTSTGAPAPASAASGATGDGKGNTGTGSGNNAGNTGGSGTSSGNGGGNGSNSGSNSGTNGTNGSSTGSNNSGGTTGNNGVTLTPSTKLPGTTKP